jgi:hypothetical protein
VHHLVSGLLLTAAKKLGAPLFAPTYRVASSS